MAKVKDILIDTATGDLLIKDGDFVIGESTKQHMNDLMVSQKGNYKLDPLIGVALRDFLLEDNNYSEDLKREIMEQYEADGINIQQMNLNSPDDIIVTGEYSLRK